MAKRSGCWRVLSLAGPTAFFPLLLNLALLSPNSAAAQTTYTVTTNAGDQSTGSLGWAINQVNANGGGVIDLSGIAGQTVSMTGAYSYVTQSVTILGANVTIDGQATYQGLNLGGGVSSVSGMSVSIANLSIVNATAQGGAGGLSNFDYGAGGGGAGLGGGIFVNTGVTLTVNNVNFNQDAAIGGAGGYVNPSSTIGQNSGGGGLVGSGGGGFFPYNPGAGGGPNGGSPGPLGSNENGGDGGWGGGGGAANGGGFTGGAGGFGGGGGGSYGIGGQGGFGGGGGGGTYTTQGAGGLYGGSGGSWLPGYSSVEQSGPGGGGAGLGGGIFVYQGASLNIIQSGFASNSAQGGAGGYNSLNNGIFSSNGQSGQGLGQDLFIYGSTVTFGGGYSSLGGSLEGTGSVMVNNASTVTLWGNNTYSGGTTLDSGRAVAGNNNAFGTGDVAFQNNGILQSGVNGLAVTNNLDLNGAGIFDSNGNGSALSGVIGGAGSFAVTDSLGGGSVTLTNASTYSGGTDLQGGTLNLGNNNALGTGAVTVENNGILQSGVNGLAVTNNLTLNGTGIYDSNGNGSALSGVIGGTGSLAVTDSTGNGNLALSGNNSYSGGTHLEGGTLNLQNNNALGTGAVTMKNGATLQSGLGGLSVGNNMTLNGAGNFDTNGNGSLWSGVIGGTGSLSVTDSVGGGALTLTGTNTYSGGTSLNGGTLSLGNTSALGTGNLTYNGGTLQTSASINLGTAVTLAGNGTFDSNGFDSTISGVVSGAGNLTKTGAGVLTLTGANTNTGLNDINNGSLVIGASGALTSTAAVSVESSGTLDLAGHDQTLGELSGAGNVTLGTGNLTVGDSTDQIFSGVLSGSGSFTKTGSGAMTLSADNSYTGATTVTGGTLALSGNNSYAGGTWVGAATLNIASDASLGTGNVVLDGGTLQAGAGLTSSKGISLTANGGTFDSNGSNSDLSGIISGTGGLDKVGSGVVTLSATNTYSGGTTVSGGELNISSLGNLGSGALVLNGGYLQTGAALTVAQGVSLTSNGGGIDTNGFDSLVSGIVSGTGALNKAGAGALTLTGTNTYSGGTNIGGGTLVAGTDANLGTGNLSLSNATLQASDSFVTTKNLSLGGSDTLDTQGNNLEIDGVLSGGVFLTKTGSGSLTLTGANSFSGVITMAGGDLDVASNANLGNINRLAFNGGTLQATGSLTSNKTLLMVGNGTFDTNGNVCSLSSTITGPGTLTVTGGGALTINGAAGRTNYRGLVNVQNADLVMGGFGGVVLQNASVSLGSTGELELANTSETIQELSGSGLLFLENGNLAVGDANNQVFSGSVSGGGALIKQGSGMLTLTGNNSFSGGMQLAGGTLNIVSGNNLGTGTLSLGAATLQAGASLSSSVPVALNGGTSLDTQNFNVTLSGGVYGGGDLTKVGTGTLTLNGQSNYTGGTNVSAGTLVVGDSVSPGAYLYGPLTVSSGALLTGYGAILGTVTNSGTIQGGGASGTLSIAQLDETSGGTLRVAVGPNSGQSGQINVLTAQLDGAVSVVSSGNSGIRSKYVILDSGTPLSGSFSSVTDNLSTLTPTLFYGTNAVTLVLVQNNVDFNANALTPNQKAMGTMLNGSLLAATDSFMDDLNNLYGLSPAQQQAALAQMGGSSYAPLAAVMVNNNFASVNLLMQRAGGTAFVPPSSFESLMAGRTAFELSGKAPNLSDGLKEADQSGERAGLWVESSSGTLSEDGDANVVGYKSQDTGFLGGYDVALSKDVRGGLWGSYNHMDLTSTDASNATGVDNYLVGLYGGPSFGNLTLTGVAAYGVDHYRTTRTVALGAQSAQALAAFDGNELTGAVRAAYALKVSGVSLNPVAGLQYTRTAVNGFTETGAGDLNLTVAARAYQSLRPLVGFDASKAYDLGGGAQLVPMVSANVSEELLALNPAVNASLEGAPGSSFTVTGLNPNPTLFGVSAGTKLSFGQGLNLFAQYLGSFGGGESSNAFNGGVDFSL